MQLKKRCRKMYSSIIFHFDLNRGCVPFCFAVLGTTKNSLLYQDSSGLLMKIMPIALQGIPHLFYSMNLLNLIE